MNLAWFRIKRNRLYAGFGVVAVVVGFIAIFTGNVRAPSEHVGVFTEYASTDFKAIPAEDLNQRYRGISSSPVKQVAQAFQAATEPKHNTPSPEMSLMSRSPDVAGTPEQNLLVATHYVPTILTPPGQSDLAFNRATPKPIPLSEIIEKRQRIANGERLYQRVVIKAAEGKHPLGGLRAAPTQPGSSDAQKEQAPANTDETNS